MTSNEFKAWFEGYIEAGGKDIKKIKKRVDQIDDKAPIIVREYPWRPWYPTWYQQRWEYTTDDSSTYTTFSWNTSGDSNSYTLSEYANEVGKMEAERDGSV